MRRLIGGATRTMEALRQRVAWFVCATIVCTAPATARAWSEGIWYDTAANDGGGGGLYFTGSPLDYELDCSVCHLPDGGPKPRIRIATTPSELASGRFTPGRTYEVRISLDNETRGLGLACSRAADESCNMNGFTARVTWDNGRLAGSWCLRPDPDDGCAGQPAGQTQDVRAAPGGGAVTSTGAQSDDTTWRAFWMAPNAEGVLSMYVAAVDGNGGNGLYSSLPLDLERDGSASRSLAAESESFANRGCSVGGTAPGPGGLWWIGWAVAGGILRWRRARGRRRRMDQCGLPARSPRRSVIVGSVAFRGRRVRAASRHPRRRRRDVLLPGGPARPERPLPGRGLPRRAECRRATRRLVSRVAEQAGRRPHPLRPVRRRDAGDQGVGGEHRGQRKPPGVSPLR